MKKLLLSFVIAFSLALGIGALTPVYADSPTDSAKAAVCQGVKGGGGTCGSGAASLQKVIKAALNILSFVAGFLAVVMIIISGIRFITSGGDAQGVAGAKKGLIYAIVGLVVVGMSQAIVHFVLKKL